MKYFRLFFLSGFLLLTIYSFFNCSAPNAASSSVTKSTANATMIYVVRHGEKALSSGAMTDDPMLSEAGQKRAEALRDLLIKEPVAALFATKYQRTQQTLQPLAQFKNLTVQRYESSDFTGLTETIKQNYSGKTVVVAGHSNTILGIAEALSGKRPFAKVLDYEYHHLFKVTLVPGKEPQLEVLKYGTVSSAPSGQ